MKKRLQRLTDLEFYELMAQAKPFEVVIKSAIIIESEIEEIFEHSLNQPKYLLSMGMTYDQKIALALALGLDDRFKPVLTTLATMRNNFAHNLEATFQKSDASNFYSNFSKLDKGIIKDTYARLSSGRGAAFADLPPEDLFILCVITLRAAIVTAHKQATVIFSKTKG